MNPNTCTYKKDYLDMMSKPFVETMKKIKFGETLIMMELSLNQSCGSKVLYNVIKLLGFMWLDLINC